MEKRPIELNTGLARGKKAGLCLSAFSVVRSVLTVAFAYVTRNVINSAVYGGEGKLWTLLLILLSLVIPGLFFLSRTYALRVTDQTVCALRRSVFSALHRKDAEALRRFHSGALLTRLMEDCRILTERYTHILPDMMGELIQLIGAAALLTVLHQGLAAVVLLVGAAVALAGLWLRRRLKRRHTVVRKETDALTALFTEALEHEELLRSTAKEETLAGRVDERQTGWYTARRALLRMSLSTASLFDFAIRLSSAALILWGAYRMGTGELTVGDFTAMLQLVALFRAPITGLTGIQNLLASSDAAYERLSELYALPEEEILPFPPGEIMPEMLVFENISFTYEGEETPVFENFSAEIDLRRWTCLTGMSGRGKSTLYRLILGLYRPQNGRIYLKTDRGDFPVSAASRHLFSYVPQSPVLFSGTVRENLRLAAADATDEELWRALTAAQCAFLRQMPEGMDTVVGQFGEGLSQGQRQRIAIARALLTEGKVLLLDEITSALDTETATQVIESLFATYPAAVFATHHSELLSDRAVDVLSLEGGDDD